MTPEQFSRDLSFAYDEVNKQPINEVWLRNILTVFNEIYITKRPDYERYLRACLEGLTSLTRLVDPKYLAHETSAALFTTDLPPLKEVNPRAKIASHREEFTTDLNPALEAFIAPFKKNFPTGNGHCYTTSDEDPRAVREWYDDMRLHQWPFIGTILFHYADQLLPPHIPIPLGIPPNMREAGMWVIGNPGKGKTNLLRHLILHDLDVNLDASFILIDSKGELINSFRRIQGLKDHLVIIEPDPDYPLALNPLHVGSGIQTIELIEYILSSLVEGATLTGLQQTLFRQILFLLQHIPKATIHTFKDIITNGIDPYMPAIGKLRPDRQDFFLKGQFASSQYRETKNQIQWRIDNLLTNDFMFQMLSSHETKLNLYDLMEQGKIIIVDNSSEKLGESGAEFLGRFVIALILAAARKRSLLPADKKKPCFVYLDEAHTVIRRDPKIPTILDECRSQRINLCVAHQRVNQLEPHVLDALTNCAVKMGSLDQDAHKLAATFQCEPDALKLTIGKFAASIRGQALAAVSVPFVSINPDQTLQDLPAMSPSDYAALIDDMRRRYCTFPLSHQSPPATPPGPTPPPSTDPREIG